MSSYTRRRKKGTGVHPVMVYLSPEALEAVADGSAQLGISRSDFVERAIVRYYDEMLRRVNK